MVNRPNWSGVPTPQSAALAYLSLTVLGNMTIACTECPVRLASRKSRALLAYLALSESTEETRERLVGLLWSESSEEKARASLRQILREIRENFATIEFDGLRADKQSVALDRQRLQLDLTEVVDEVEDGRVHPILLEVKRLPETLLAGFDTIDPAFRVWLLAKRQTLHDRLVRALESAIREVPGATAAIEKSAAAILNLDPTHEEAARYLIKSRAGSGDVPGALRVYKELWDLLDAEYDIEPSPATQQLIVEIKGGMSQAGVEPPADIGVDDRLGGLESIAKDQEIRLGGPVQQRDAPRKFIMSVNEFDVSGVKPEKTYFVHGFRHELIASLVRFREWYVRDRSQRTPGRGSDPAPDLPEYCIEASALQANGAIRLILTLREISSGVYIWSDRYQITLESWFDVQQNIVRRVAIALNVHLSAKRLTRLAREPDATLRVYDRWLRGQALIQNYNPADWHRAADIFLEIISEVPGFAPAYSSLVQLYNSVHLVHPGVYRSPTRHQQALELARSAARLDPVDSRSQLCLGWAHAMAKQYDQAELNLGLAYDLNENDPWTLISSAHGFAFCGTMERASKLADQADKLALMPSRTHWAYQVGIRFLREDYRGCVEAADRACDVIPNLPGWKASALYHLDLRSQAADERRRFISLMQSRWFGSEPPTEQAVTRWFLHLFPIKRREDWQRLRDGLAGAGADVGEIDHHQW